jgi:hypothetical protein
MSPADRPDPRRRILGLALQLAAYPPARKHEHVFEARVPWRLITELRDALDEAGADWKAIRTALREPE